MPESHEHGLRQGAPGQVAPIIAPAKPTFPVSPQMVPIAAGWLPAQCRQRRPAGDTQDDSAEFARRGQPISYRVAERVHAQTERYDRRDGGDGGVGSGSRRLELGHEARRTSAAAERADGARGIRHRHDLPVAFGGLARVAGACRGGAGRGTCRIPCAGSAISDGCRATRTGSAGRHPAGAAASARPESADSADHPP